MQADSDVGDIFRSQSDHQKTAKNIVIFDGLYECRGQMLYGITYTPLGQNISILSIKSEK